MAIRIAYVDDEVELGELFADCFSSPDVQVVTYSDPQKALNEMTANPPDVIFLDYRMAGMNGDELAQKLPAHIPKFLVTGDIEPQTKYAFEKVLVKPAPLAEVTLILEKYKK